MSITGSCHCGTVRVTIPRAPKQLTNCNCSLCRRIGGLWCYYLVDEVKIDAPPDAMESYIWGDRTLRTVRCRHCGSVTHWSPLERKDDSKMGVNARIFTPEAIGDVKIRLFDGADTWRFID